METKNKIRILIAKPGLDGHDKGAKIVALALRDAGYEVIYSGLHQTLEQIIQTAAQESVDVIGLSIMSGAHLPISEKLIAMMKEKGLDDIFLTVGGVIPYQDIPKLKEMGVSEVFPGGTSFEEITKGMNRLF
ncbi:MAG: cobalamin B12-binding domain-containing protein [Desulfobacula sp.]|jgi:methylmalonyl-CoA mutase C-terminal domain/subunit|uniref:cobalamin B12-binding domain-containing protein n=1 Tax=Desulfobacula sp. TaxID=2593537 RepID=UPI001DE9A1AE|nr:cobalamin B12-binding domain-containing protein [Desulfobacula sp.]MBT3486668.1 cobalamin B12-binding domain-containing protein [Desulfobacula sp.]MBT3804888.1 cobalamin B12-binding domain-containing protein [Desulfobacula sp.]MBT4026661.1 cobalamin B12-binding domain-containing protein [Desulfobacula sp.]MBT4200489.1 cobalamin B12-binding domain-containing protein [Desulfobacula sp.]